MSMRELNSNRLKDQYVSKYTPTSASLSTGLREVNRWFRDGCLLAPRDFSAILCFAKAFSLKHSSVLWPHGVLDVPIVEHYNSITTMLLRFFPWRRERLGIESV